MPAGDEIQAWELLVRFQRQATRAMDERLRERFGLSLDDYDVLYQLRLAGAPVRMTDLAQRLIVANSSCHRIVGRLAERGLVTRRPGPTDRRQVLVELTSEGRRLQRRMAAVHTRDIQGLLARLDDGERAELARLLGRLDAAAGAEETPG